LSFSQGDAAFSRGFFFFFLHCSYFFQLPFGHVNGTAFSSDCMHAKTWQWQKRKARQRRIRTEKKMHTDMLCSTSTIPANWRGLGSSSNRLGVGRGHQDKATRGALHLHGVNGREQWRTQELMTALARIRCDPHACARATCCLLPCTVLAPCPLQPASQLRPPPAVPGESAPGREEGRKTRARTHCPVRPAW
jgi:hypothetical protein